MFQFKGSNSGHLNINCGVPQGSTLGPLLFIVYINDLHLSLKFATSSHFADDTCLIYSSKNAKTLETNLNYDLKNLNQWLCANRLSLNIDKTRLLIFHSKYNKRQHNINIKMNGIRLKPSQSVKYLGVYLDDNLSWDFHIKELSKKLCRTNGIISKLRHYVPKSTLLLIYYSLFYSHISYGISVWSLTTQKNINVIWNLQKKCVRLMNFASFNDHSNPLFLDNKLLKFNDVILMNQLLLANQFTNDVLPDDLRSLFLQASSVHGHNTRISDASFFVPSINSTNYGELSLKYKVPYTWNEFSRVCPDIVNKSYNCSKKYLSRYFSEKYSNEEHV